MGNENLIKNGLQSSCRNKISLNCMHYIIKKFPRKIFLIYKIYNKLTIRGNNFLSFIARTKNDRHRIHCTDHRCSDTIADSVYINMFIWLHLS